MKIGVAATLAVAIGSTINVGIIVVATVFVGVDAACCIVFVPSIVIIVAAVVVTVAAVVAAVVVTVAAVIATVVVTAAVQSKKHKYRLTVYYILLTCLK